MEPRHRRRSDDRWNGVLDSAHAHCYSSPLGRLMVDALTWSGTFHAIGARLLRDYSDQIGLDRAFTIHDRGDSADLINLVRHDLGLSKTERRFPNKNTCLAAYSRVVNAEASLADVLATNFPWCAEWEGELKKLFANYVEAKQRQNVLVMMICSSTGPR